MSPSSQEPGPITVSVVIPALNEEAGIRGAVEELDEFLRPRVDDYEMMLFNDGSHDRTGEIMDQLARENPRVVVTHNAVSRNVGGVYKQGIQQARFTYIFLFPGDNENPASTLEPVIDAIGNADITVPYTTNASAVRPLSRVLISSTYTRLINTLFGLDLKYYNGTSVFRADRLKQLDIHADSSVYQAEMIIKLLKAGSTRSEVGVLLGQPNESRSKALRLKNVAGVAVDLARLMVDVHLRRTRR